MKFWKYIVGMLVVSMSLVMAEEETVIQEQTPNKARFAENVWEVSAENSQLFAVGHKHSYHLTSQMLTFHWQLDDVGNEGWRRGNTEWVVSGFYQQALKGVENRFAGILFGPRYNFVQEGWAWVPYLESRVGLGFTDSTDVTFSQGQDFVFTFMIGTGVRYVVSDEWSVSLAAHYQHFSNGGLSEPDRANNGLDLLGPQVAVDYRF